MENNKVERAIFNKDGDVLQALAEGRRALVIVPKDPQLLDTLMKHNVDFQGEPRQQSDYGASSHRKDEDQHCSEFQLVMSQCHDVCQNWLAQGWTPRTFRMPMPMHVSARVSVIVHVHVLIKHALAFWW